MKNRMLIHMICGNKTNCFGLLACGILFLCGCVFGAISAGYINDSTTIREPMTRILPVFAGTTATEPNVFSALTDNLKYHITAVFLGFSVLGVVFIPLLSAVRGFFLSFSIAAIIRLFGGKGIFLALSMFGINTIIAIPCYFILSASSFSASLHLSRLLVSGSGKSPLSPFNRRYLLICVICFAVLILLSLVDAYLTPHMIAYAASHI